MDRIQELATACSVHPVLLASLVYRGFSDKDIESVLLYPSAYKKIHEPLTGAEKAAEIILETLRENRGVAVFADYDCDGITSGYIMFQGILKAKGIMNSKSEVSVHYPQRSEGYGLNMDFCRDAVNRKIGLVITVDNGITQKQTVEYLKENGVKVVITDHHEPKHELLPRADAIVDPCLSDIERKYMAGAAVAWNVVEAMQPEYAVPYPETESWCPELLPAVMVGTISDIMPFSPENAAYIAYGLDRVNKGEAGLFLQEFKEAAGSLNLNTKDISFGIAPKINAASRMGDTRLGAAGWFADSEEKAKKFIEILEQMNKNRKAISKEAKAAVADIDPGKSRIIVFDGSGYPKGMHGIIAGEISKLFEAYPSFCYSDIGNGIYSGSVRCNNEALDLPAMFRRQVELGNILSFAGHARSCVIELKKDKLQDFIDSFSKDYDNQELPDIVKYYDAKASLKLLGDEFLKQVLRIPFTVQETPVFCIPDVEILEVMESKSNPENIKLKLIDSTSMKKVWCWGWKKKYELLGAPKKVDIICHIVQDFMYKDKVKATLDIIDILPKGVENHGIGNP